MKDFPWFKSYPAGTPHEVKLYEYNSVTEIFEESCKKFKDKVAVENMGVTLTFAQVDELSRNFAAYLQQELKLKKGDRIAIQMPNVLQFMVAFIGALRAGGDEAAQRLQAERGRGLLLRAHQRSYSGVRRWLASRFPRSGVPRRSR